MHATGLPCDLCNALSGPAAFAASHIMQCDMIQLVTGDDASAHGILSGTKGPDMARCSGRRHATRGYVSLWIRQQSGRRTN